MSGSHAGPAIDAGPVSIADRDAHLWITRDRAIADPAVLRRYDAILTAGERARRDRLWRACDRHQFLVTRALVRAALSHHADVDPAAWRFRTNRFGRPAIDDPVLSRRLRFNVSHTDGLVVCLITGRLAAGVDVEPASRGPDIVGVADKILARPELDDLDRMPADERERAAVGYWTLKEAFVKALGRGMSADVRDACFDVRASPATAVFGGSVRDELPSAWQFVRLAPTPDHRAAIAVRRGDDPDVVVTVRDAIPLVSAGEPRPVRGW